MSDASNPSDVQNYCLTRIHPIFYAFITETFPITIFGKMQTPRVTINFRRNLKRWFHPCASDARWIPSVSEILKSTLALATDIQPASYFHHQFKLVTSGPVLGIYAFSLQQSAPKSKTESVVMMFLHSTFILPLCLHYMESRFLVYTDPNWLEEFHWKTLANTTADH